jgi:hypothetical protein
MARVKLRIPNSELDNQTKLDQHIKLYSTIVAKGKGKSLSIDEDGTDIVVSTEDENYFDTYYKNDAITDTITMELDNVEGSEAARSVTMATASIPTAFFNANVHPSFRSEIRNAVPSGINKYADVIQYFDIGGGETRFDYVAVNDGSTYQLRKNEMKQLDSVLGV